MYLRNSYKINIKKIIIHIVLSFNTHIVVAFIINISVFQWLTVFIVLYRNRPLLGVQDQK